MEAISKKTVGAFGEQANTFENALILMRSIGSDLSKVGDKHKGDYLFGSLHILFARNLILLLSAYQAALTGLYGTARTLMRVVLENALLMRYFESKPEEAEKWTKDAEWYLNHRPKVIRNTLFRDKSKLLEDYRNAYSAFSSYVHPSNRGWEEIIAPRGNGMVFIRYDPDYDENLSANVLNYLMLLSKLTLKPILTSFISEINESRLREVPELQKKIDGFLLAAVPD
jgi:hypothetical protein